MFVASERRSRFYSWCITFAVISNLVAATGGQSLSPNDSATLVPRSSETSSGCKNSTTQDAFITCVINPEHSGNRIWEHPNARDGTPTPVYVIIHPDALLEVDELSSQVLVRFVVGFTWRDERLAHRATHEPLNVTLSAVYAHPELDRAIPIERIWIPFIRAVQATGAVDTTLQNEPNNRAVAQLRENGDVRVKYELLDWYACEFHNTLFPYDVQKCDLAFSAPNILPVEHPPNIPVPPEAAEVTQRYIRNMHSSTVVGEWRMVGRLRNPAYDFQYFGSHFKLGLVRYRLTLVRAPQRLMYIWVWAPLGLVVTTVVTTFYVCDPGERASFVGSTILAVFLLVLALSEKLPASVGSSLPFIIRFYAILVTVLFATLITSGVPQTVANYAVRFENEQLKRNAKISASKTNRHQVELRNAHQQVKVGTNGRANLIRLVMAVFNRRWVSSSMFVTLYVAITGVTMYQMYNEAMRGRLEMATELNLEKDGNGNFI